MIIPTCNLLHYLRLRELYQHRRRASLVIVQPASSICVATYPKHLIILTNKYGKILSRCAFHNLFPILHINFGGDSCRPTRHSCLRPIPHSIQLSTLIQ